MLTDEEVDRIIYSNIHGDNESLARCGSSTLLFSISSEVAHFIMKTLRHKAETARSREDVKFYIFRDKQDEAALLAQNTLPRDFKDNLFMFALVPLPAA